MKWLCEEGAETSLAAKPSGTVAARLDVARPATMHLAIDEAILLSANEAGASGEDQIRFWEFARPTVVLGRSSKVDKEVRRGFCESQNITVQRRSSGGATIVGGPGCLMYSVVLTFHDKPFLARIDAAHQFVMARVRAAVAVQVPEVRLQGICDLTIDDQKFSGNSLRLSKHALMYHGTILYDFDLDLLANCLDIAPRQPDYRNNREHDSFVTNIAIDRDRLIDDLAGEFEVSGAKSYAEVLPSAKQLVTDRYELDSWRYRH